MNAAAYEVVRDLVHLIEGTWADTDHSRMAIADTYVGALNTTWTHVRGRLVPTDIEDYGYLDHDAKAWLVR